MSQENVEVIRRAFEVFNRGDLDEGVLAPVVAGDEVVTWVTFSGRGTQSGVETSLDLWHVWAPRDGRVVHGRSFTDREKALEAAGLEE
jgi:ketosteroid isomerase-like protein